MAEHIAAEMKVEYLFHPFKKGCPAAGKNRISIAEVAYEVGFNSSRNFIKFFKEEFHVTPTQYLADKKEKDT